MGRYAGKDAKSIKDEEMIAMTKSEAKVKEADENWKEALGHFSVVLSSFVTSFEKSQNGVCNHGRQ